MKFLSSALIALALVAPSSAGEKLTIKPRLVGEPVNVSLYLPDSTPAIVTVQMAELLRKMPIEKQLARTPLIDGMAKQLGFGLNDIEHLTLALPMLDLQALTMVCTLKEPLDQDAYLKDNFPDAKADATKKYFYSEAKTTCVCFLDKRTLLLTANDQIMRLCMMQAANKKRTPALASVLKQANDHDVYFWLDATALPKEALPRSAGLEAFSCGINVGDRLQLCVRAECEDETSQAWAKRVLRCGVDGLRAQLLMMTAMSQLADVMPESAKDMGQMLHAMGLPLKLMTVAEQGLQKAEIETDATNVTLTAAIPLDAKALRPELLGLLRLLENTGDGIVFGTTKMAGHSLPSGQPLDPKTFDPSMFPQPSPLPTNPIPAGMWSPLPPPSPLPPGPIPVPSSLPSAPPVAPSSLPGTAPSVIPSGPFSPPAMLPPATLPLPTLPPMPVSPSPVMPVAAAGLPKEITITVANTCDGEIPIYEVLPTGEYKHVATVDKGESSDLKLKVGQRYLAVTPGKSAPIPAEGGYLPTRPRENRQFPLQLVSFTPEKANDIWLLRRKKD